MSLLLIPLIISENKGHPKLKSGVERFRVRHGKLCLLVTDITWFSEDERPKLGQTFHIKAV